MQEEVSTAEKEWERQRLKVPPSFATHLVGLNESLGPVTQPIPNGIVFAVDNGPEKEEGDGLRRRRVYTAVIALPSATLRSQGYNSVREQKTRDSASATETRRTARMSDFGILWVMLASSRNLPL